MAHNVERSIAIVVYPSFELLDLSGPLCAFNVAACMHGTPYALTVISARGGSVVSCSGVSVGSSKAIRDRSIDTLLVVGGPEGAVLECGRGTVALLEDLAPRARRVASVCTGAFLLAAAGLLDGRRATTHWRYAAALQRRFPKLRVDADRIFINDGNVWTAAGITSGIDLALALIEEDFGAELSKAVAKDLVVYHRRPGAQSQFSTILELEPASGRIKDALSFAREHLHEPLTVERLAGTVCIGVRQFARAFVNETGETPAKAIERLRAEAAIPLIEKGTEPIESVARSVGFGDEERMRRAFVRIYGQSPQALRRVSRLNSRSGSPAIGEAGRA
jgi:transcriptional regulator GlxA family with amidase domain